MTLQDFVDPETRKKLDAQHSNTQSLIQKLESGGENAKEAAARKAEEAKRKLEMLKMQAQLAAAAGDRKAAARIAKEAAQVAKELGQAVKGGAGGGGAGSVQAGAQANASQASASTSGGAIADTAPDGVGNALPGATNLAPAAPGGASEAAPAQVPSETPAGPERRVSSVPARGDDSSGDGVGEGEASAAPPPSDAGLPGLSGADAGRAGLSGTEREQAGRDGNLPEGLAERRDAILRDGADRKAQAEFQAEIRRIMDGLRAVHRQMKGLAEKDGSAGMKAQMQSAARDMADADHLVDQAFGGAGATPWAVPSPGTPVPLDIRV
ncbi:hypothetical protein [Niveispirillum fermenti]|uniref:hypothetical protein n=1 Tax=Niveispirillum fermenti TaxID=1233113 RepID=UPI003A849277